MTENVGLEHESKKAKVAQFWSSVLTRKQYSEEGSWKMVNGTVMMKHYGLSIAPGTTYSICAYDLDNTLITTNSGRVLARDSRDWKFLSSSVPKRLKEELAKALLSTTPLFVIFSNQLNLNSKDTEKASFQMKIDSLISKLGISDSVSIVCLCSTARDYYRKPCKGMWEILKDDVLEPKKCGIYMETSFFVGDAAGRLANWKPERSADWSAVDRKFAFNVGLKFFTPEEYFLEEDIINSYDLGRNPADIKLHCLESCVVSYCRKETRVEVIMAVGSPGSGKTTLYRRVFEPLGYVHVNRDTLKTMPKCLNLVKESIASGKSVYIDNTNPTKGSRSEYLNIVSAFNIPVRCFQFTADEWLCRHLDVFRSVIFNIEPLPAVAFASFHSKYQPPNEEEGFEAIVQVPFSGQFDDDYKLQLFKQYLF